MMMLMTDVSDKLNDQQSVNSETLDGSWFMKSSMSEYDQNNVNSLRKLIRYQDKKASFMV